MTIRLLHTKYGTSHIPIDKVYEIVKSNFEVDNHRLVRAQVVQENADQISHITVRLFSKESRRYSISQVKVDQDYNVLGVEHHYQPTHLDHENQPHHAAPNADAVDNTIQFLAFSPTNRFFPQAGPKEQAYAREVGQFAQAKGYKTKILVGAEATTANVLACMKSSSLVGCFYDGDANTSEIATTDGSLTAKDITDNLAGKLSKVTNIWLACEAYNDPMKAAMTTSAKSQVYAAGINDLAVGPSDKAAVCAMKAALSGQPMKAAFEACRKQNDNATDQWGYYEGGSDTFGK